MLRKEWLRGRAIPRVKHKTPLGAHQVVADFQIEVKREAGLGSARYFTTSWNEAEWLRLPEVPVTVIV